MRELKTAELTQVSGAGSYCTDDNKKGNNGWGNGGDDGVPSNNEGAIDDFRFKEDGDSVGSPDIKGGGKNKCAR